MWFFAVVAQGYGEFGRDLAALSSQWSMENELLSVFDSLMAEGRIPLSAGVRRRIEPAQLVDMTYDAKHHIHPTQTQIETNWNISADYVASLSRDMRRLPFVAAEKSKVHFLGSKDNYAPIDVKADLVAAEYVEGSLHIVASTGRMVELVAAVPRKGNLNITRSRWEIGVEDGHVGEFTALAYARPFILLGSANGHLVLVKIPSGNTTIIKVANSRIHQLESKNANEVYVLTDTSIGVFSTLEKEFIARPCQIPSRSFAQDIDNHLYVATHEGKVVHLAVENCRVLYVLPSVHGPAPKIVTANGKPHLVIASGGGRACVFLNKKHILMLNLPPVHLARIRFTQAAPVLSLTTADPVARYEVPLPLGRFGQEVGDGVLDWVLYFMDNISRAYFLGAIFVIVLLYNIRRVKKRKEHS